MLFKSYKAMPEPIVIEADSPPGKRVTRLAPSPTGALHLGNARTFMINWALARQDDWRIVLRVEDLDTPRTKEGADQQAIDDLAWLGMDWDEGPFTQVDDLSPYQDALSQLWHKGAIYPCVCTRREIENAQSAPHGDEHELRYPGTCRPSSQNVSEGTQMPKADGTPTTAADAVRRERSDAGDTTTALPQRFADAQAQSADRPIAWRLIVPEQDLRAQDEFCGWHNENMSQQVGDFILASKAGLPAYQLAVVVDDARQGITDVVRGDDLLRSTARQLWIYTMLELHPKPRYWHLPLVRGEDGRRLAKRHGDTRIAMYREQGVAAERVIGMLAYWCGMITSRQPMSAAEFRDGFKISKLPHEGVTFTSEDHAWLIA